MNKKEIRLNWRYLITGGKAIPEKILKETGEIKESSWKRRDQKNKENLSKGLKN